MADAEDGYVELDAPATKTVLGAKLLDDENGADAANHTGLHASTRVCTDRPCLVIFISYLVFMGWMFQYAQTNGDWRKLTHGFDWKDDLCGVAEAVKDAPFLFWCSPPEGLQWQMNDGICVKECPTGDAVTSMCPGPAEVVNTQKAGPVDKDGKATDIIVKGITRTLHERSDYATQTWLQYCFPVKTAALYASFVEAAADESMEEQVMQGLDFAQENYVIFIYVLLVGLVLGYLLLFLVNILLRPLLYTLLGIVEIGGLGVAVTLLYTPLCADSGGCPYVVYPSLAFYRNNSTICLMGGFLALVAWVAVTALLYCQRDAINAVVQALQESATLVRQMPTLLLQPLLQVLIKLPALVFLLYGLAWLISLGEPQPQKLEEATSGTSVSGIGRSFKFKTNDKYLLAAWIYGGVWVLETLTALGQYVISHAVVVHQVNGTHQWLPLLHGYKNGLVFHMGTLAFGGFVLGTLRLVNAIVSFCLKVMSHGKDKDGKDKQSCVIEVLCCCCLCCLSCLLEMVKLLNDLVYTDCALDGNDYISAVRDVIKVVSTNPMAYAIMETAVSLLKILGILSITGVGTYGVYLYLTWEFDPDPPVAAAVLTCLGSMAILLFISLSFMNAFCQAALTVMYVDMWEKMGGKKGEASGDGDRGLALEDRNHLEKVRRNPVPHVQPA